MWITLELTGITWRWDIIDGEGESIANGSRSDYFDACRDALKHFDAIKREIL